MPLFKASQSPATIVTTSSGETRSQTEPPIKSIGDTWLELNSSNFPVYGWAWRWDGSKWLSPDLELDYSINNLPGRFDYFIHCDPKFNYYFKTINSNSKVSYPQTTSYFWQFQLWRVSPYAGTYQTQFFDGTTIGQDQNEWRRRSTPLNVLVDVAATLTEFFNLIIQPNAGSSYISGAIQLIYNLSRLP